MAAAAQRQTVAKAFWKAFWKMMLSHPPPTLLSSQKMKEKTVMEKPNFECQNGFHVAKKGQCEIEAEIGIPDPVNKRNKRTKVQQ